MVGANFEGLVSSHNQTDLAVLLVLEQAERSSTTLLPFTLALGVLGKLEHLAPHVEYLLLGLLVCHGLDLLGKLVDGLEVDILRLGSGLFL